MTGSNDATGCFGWTHEDQLCLGLTRDDQLWLGLTHEDHLWLGLTHEDRDNKIAASIPDQCSLGKPLDPCLAEYSVTGLTRREASGSICKALF